MQVEAHLALRISSESLSRRGSAKHLLAHGSRTWLDWIDEIIDQDRSSTLRARARIRVVDAGAFWRRWSVINIEFISLTHLPTRLMVISLLFTSMPWSRYYFNNRLTLHRTWWVIQFGWKKIKSLDGGWAPYHLSKSVVLCVGSLSLLSSALHVKYEDPDYEQVLHLTKECHFRSSTPVPARSTRTFCNVNIEIHPKGQMK